MSNVKTKYEEARDDLQRFHECFYDDSKKNTAELKRKKIDNFITSCEKDVALNFRLFRDLGMVERELEEEKTKREATEQKYEALARDVKRYIELMNSDEWTGGEVENLREEIALRVGETK